MEQDTYSTYPEENLCSDQSRDPLHAKAHTESADQLIPSSSSSSSSRRQRPPRAAQWKPVSYVLGLFLASALFALGHHLFNSSINGKAVALASWQTVRSKVMTIDGVDALFAVPTNVLSLFELDLWRGGFITIVLSSVLWALPLVTVFTPASLTTDLSISSTPTRTAVPTFDASSTNVNLYLEDNIEEGVTPFLQRLASTTILGVFNCSVAAPPVQWPVAEGAVTPLWSGITFGNSTVDAFGLGGSLYTYGGYNGNFGLRFANHTTLSKDLVPHNISCLLHNGSYSIASDFTSTNATTRVVDVTLLDQYPFYYSEMNEYYLDDLTGYPTLTTQTRAALNYEAIKDSVYKHLNGTVVVTTDQMSTYSSSRETVITNTPLTLDVAQSSLTVNRENITWVPDLPAALEQLMHNITLSLVANGGSFGTNTTLTALVVGSHTIFRYTPSSLWIPYAIGLALGALCCLDGILSIGLNKAEGKAGFRAFLEASRSPLAGEGSDAGKAMIKFEAGHGFQVVGGREEIEME
ncbi:hypothetical protein RQP46_007414 [Phenoliferia psychrophenolica]